MDMRMMLQGLTLGVEHTEEANLRSEMLRIGSNLQQSRGAGAENRRVVVTRAVVNSHIRAIRQTIPKR